MGGAVDSASLTAKQPVLALQASYTMAAMVGLPDPADSFNSSFFLIKKPWKAP